MVQGGEPLQLGTRMRHPFSERFLAVEPTGAVSLLRPASPLALVCLLLGGFVAGIKNLFYRDLWDCVRIFV